MFTSMKVSVLLCLPQAWEVAVFSKNEAGVDASALKSEEDLCQVTVLK